MNSNVKNISEKQRCKMEGRLQTTLDKHQNISQIFLKYCPEGQQVSTGDSRMVKKQGQII